MMDNFEAQPWWLDVQMSPKKYRAQVLMPPFSRKMDFLLREDFEASGLEAGTDSNTSSQVTETSKSLKSGKSEIDDVDNNNSFTNNDSSNNSNKNNITDNSSSSLTNNSNKNNINNNKINNNSRFDNRWCDIRWLQRRKL